MAATPKRSFRRTVASTVEERSPRFLLGSLALAMVISLVAGLGIGIKIGEHRKSNKAKPVATTKPTKPRNPRRGVFAFKGGPIVGTIRFKGPHAIVVAKKKGKVTLGLVPKTVVEVTTAATRADIKAGAHVLFVLKKGSKLSPPDTTPTGLTSSSASPATTPTTRPSSLTATEIIVVNGADNVRLGSVVESVTANSMTFVLPNGKPLTISTAGAKIVQTIPGTKANLTVGKRVLVRSLLGPAPKKTKKTKKKPGGLVAIRKRVALEIVILPAASAFV